MLHVENSVKFQYNLFPQAYTTLKTTISIHINISITEHKLFTTDLFPK